jgi:hypothetical protein
MSDPQKPKAPVVDLRSRTRCPICTGPVYQNVDGRDRCRNSLCVYNHREAQCPRCGCQDLRSAWFASGQYHYSCSKCQNSWQTPA